MNKHKEVNVMPYTKDISDATDTNVDLYDQIVTKEGVVVLSTTKPGESYSTTNELKEEKPQ